jgi:hypothetical protein
LRRHSLSRQRQQRVLLNWLGSVKAPMLSNLPVSNFYNPGTPIQAFVKYPYFAFASSPTGIE